MQKRLVVLLVFITAISLFKVNGQSDSLELLQVERLEFSANGFSSDISVPEFSNYADDFTFGHRFTTAQLSGFTPIDTFAAKTTYSGFQVNFVFKSSLFKDSLSRVRNKLTFAFETGSTTANLYQIVVNDTSSLSYNFKSNTFRLTFGYKHFISKKGRFRVYTGAELINEFNISAAVFENQFVDNFISVSAERKLFAKKSYNIYASIPLGFDFRLFKRASIFLQMHMAVGFENLDPIRKVNLYSGTRFGVSLSI